MATTCALCTRLPDRVAEADTILTSGGLRTLRKTDWCTFSEATAHSKHRTAERRNEVPEEPVQLGSLEIAGDSGTLTTGTLDAPILDWGPILAIWGLDPGAFEVVEPVTLKAWDGYAKDAEGEITSKRLYSYKARVQRKRADLDEALVEQALASIRKWKPSSRRTPGTGLGEECTLVVNWSDWQIGKSEGGGIEATQQRVLDGFERTQQRLKDLRRIGRNVEGIAVNSMGDPYEGCMGNYASQLFTVEANLRKQMRLTLELMLQGAKALLPLAEQAQFSGVLCNHGELGRGGGNKNQTSDSDSGSALLIEMLRMILDESDHFGHVEWNIPHDEMVTPVVFSGVRTALSHGHKAPGNIDKYVDDQSRVLTYLREFQPELWILAHRHHFHAADLGAYTYLQCPANDGGSKWLTDMKGRWSTPGTLTFLVGRHDPRDYSDIAIL